MQTLRTSAMWVARAAILGLAFTACSTGTGTPPRYLSPEIPSPAADAGPTASTAPTPSSASTTPAPPAPTAPPSAPATPAGSASTCAFSPTVTVLGGWDPAWPNASIVSCLGDTTVDVTGFLAEPWGIGGTANGLEPEWLGEWDGLPKVLWLKPHPTDGCLAETDCVWLFIFAPDPAALPLSPDRWVTLSGHFDDPAARTCHWAGRGDPVPVARAVETCRGHFVVTAIADAEAPSS